MLVHVLVSCLLYISCTATQLNATKNKWVVLVAGSNQWVNYRHQADIAHAYLLLTARGIPASRIITFAYDDIAYNKQNPFPGTVFNDYNHINYYKTFRIDYKGQDVTPLNFLRVLRGDPTLKAQGKKVLQSGPEDDVFVYFSGHGAPLLLAFPNTILDAKSLLSTINYMYSTKMYKKMVFYIEACFSGSMFDRILPVDKNVFATTAANPQESSYAIYCEDPMIPTCLADEYSYNWIVDSVTNDPTKETMGTQFNNVKYLTKQSHAQLYGDRTVTTLTVSEFQGSTKSGILNLRTTKTQDYVPSNQVHMHTLMREVMQSGSHKEHAIAKRNLIRAIKLGELVVETMDLIVETVILSSSKTSYLMNATIEQELSCYQTCYPVFMHRCFSIHRVPEVAQQLHKLLDLCQKGVQASEIVIAIEKICQ